MTRAAKIVYLSALVLGLLLGISLRLLEAKSADSFRGMLQPMAANAQYGEFAGRQFKNADPEHARQALVGHANYLEQADVIAPEPSYKWDLALTYTRLALLEDARHDARQATAYRSIAQHWYKKSTQRQLTDPELSRAMMNLEQFARK